jgi:hypothetical protein
MIMMPAMIFIIMIIIGIMVGVVIGGMIITSAALTVSVSSPA